MDSVPSGRRRRAVRRLGVALVVVLAVAAVWTSGTAGRLISDRILPRFLPLRIGSELQITDIRVAGRPAACDRGAVLTLSSGRINDMLRRAVWWSRLLPPGLIRDGVAVSASWAPSETPFGDGNPLTLTVVIDDRVGWRPRLVGRCPVREFNDFMRAEYGEKWTKRKKWALGHYEMTYRPDFESCRVYSDEGNTSDPVRERRLFYEAAGTLHVKVDEGLINASARGRVPDFRGSVDVRFRRDAQGVGLDYEFHIDVLKVNVRNLAVQGDEALSDELRESMTESLNKPKKRQKLSKKRFPSWIPLDTVLDFRLTP